MNLKNSEKFWVLGLFLGITGLVSALILAVVSNWVKTPIAQAELRNTNQALGQILPPFDNQPSAKRIEFNSPSGWPVSFMAAVKDGQIVAFAAEAINPRGYAGNIQALVGLEIDGAIRAVLITKQNETPGLGANVCQRKVQKTIFNLFSKPDEGLAPNKILDQFKGKKTALDVNWSVKKDGGDIDFISGATVTSRAVTLLVSEIDRTFLLNRDRIIQELTPVGREQL